MLVMDTYVMQAVMHYGYEETLHQAKSNSRLPKTIDELDEIIGFSFGSEDADKVYKDSVYEDYKILKYIGYLVKCGMEKYKPLVWHEAMSVEDKTTPEYFLENFYTIYKAQTAIIKGNFIARFYEDGRLEISEKVAERLGIRIPKVIVLSLIGHDPVLIGLSDSVQKTTRSENYFSPDNYNNTCSLIRLAKYTNTTANQLLGRTYNPDEFMSYGLVLEPRAKSGEYTIHHVDQECDQLIMDLRHLRDLDKRDVLKNIEIRNNIITINGLPLNEVI